MGGGGKGARGVSVERSGEGVVEPGDGAGAVVPRV
jgi:hypothetical protein